MSYSNPREPGRNKARAAARRPHGSERDTEAQQGAIDLGAVQRVYGAYAPVYDASFGWIVSQYQKRLVKTRSFSCGDRILEIGVGTGLSLPLYPRDVSVVGIDVSQQMLARARARVQRLGLENVELHLRDAEHSGFADQSFDCVMLMFVLSVTPDPDALLREARRVCRRGGDIYILNHFGGNAGLGLFERELGRFARWVGFRSDMPLAVLERFSPEIRAVEAFAPLGFFKLVHIQP